MIKIERKETPHTQEAMDGFETVTCKPESGNLCF